MPCGSLLCNAAATQAAGLMLFLGWSSVEFPALVGVDEGLGFFPFEVLDFDAAADADDVVAADLGKFAADGDAGGGGWGGFGGFLFLLDGFGEAGGGVFGTGGGDLVLDEVDEALEGVHAGGGAEEAGADVATDAFHHAFKVVVGFVFVFVEGVFLGVAAQADAAAEFFHLGEVVLPVAVEAADDDVAFDGGEGFGGFKFFALAVEVFDAVEDFFAHGGGVEAADFVEGDAQGEGAVDPSEEGVELGVVGVGVVVGEEGVGACLDFVGDDAEEEFAGVVAAEGLVADAVDDFALVVEDVVVLEEAFADGVVLAFDAFLGGADAAVEEGVFEGFAFFE